MTRTSAHPTVEKISLVRQKAMGETCARKAHTATSTFSSSLNLPQFCTLGHYVAVEIGTGAGLHRWAHVVHAPRTVEAVVVGVVVAIIKI